MQVEVRYLRAFVAVAEELNFTRAAERLHLAQQALSSQIQQLEQRMDAQLFLRTSRRVELTPAGHALLAQAPGLLSALDGAVESARQAARGEAGELTVGLLATAALDVTPRTLRAFSAARPAVRVSLRNVTFDEPTGGVATGEADVALVWLPFTTEGLAVEPLYDDPRLAVLASDHPLARRAELQAADLTEYPMGWIEELDPVARDFWTLADFRARRPAAADHAHSGLRGDVRGHPIGKRRGRGAAVHLRVAAVERRGHPAGVGPAAGHRRGLLARARIERARGCVRPSGAQRARRTLVDPPARAVAATSTDCFTTRSGARTVMAYPTKGL